TVMLWDRGTWRPHGDPEKDYRRGKLSFAPEGERLKGEWTRVKMRGERSDDGKNWLLIKSGDHATRAKAKDPLKTHVRSVATGRTLDEISAAGGNGAPRKKTMRSKAARNRSAGK